MKSHELTVTTEVMATMPSGDPLTTRFLTVRGSRPGRKVYIQANNHGGEVAGNLAIVSLLEIIRDVEVSGEIVLAPHVNPVSLAQTIRGSRQGVYDDVTGQNFNRLFRLLTSKSDPWGIDLDRFVHEHREAEWPAVREAFKRELRAALGRFREHSEKHGASWKDRYAFALQSHSCDADIFLDLHTGDVAPRYLYAFKSETGSARYLNSPHTLVMDDDKFGGAADEAHLVPWSSLRNAFAAAGREVKLDVESYTVELGNLETADPEAAWRDAQNLANYLRHQGVLAGEPALAAMERHACHIDDYIVYASPAAGLAVWRKKAGDQVRSGDTVAEIHSMSAIESFQSLGRVITPVLAQEDGILVTRHRGATVVPRIDLFKLMTNVYAL